VKPIYTVENTREIFMLVERLNGVTQMEKWHPEGDAFQHTLQVVNWALKESDDIDLVLAALLHDVGKFKDTIGHDKWGADMIEDYVSHKTLWLVKQHMRICWYMSGKMKRKFKIRKLLAHPYFVQGVELYRWDQLGRDPKVKLQYNKLELIEGLNKVVARHFPKGLDYTREDAKNEAKSISNKDIRNSASTGSKRLDEIG